MNELGKFQHLLDIMIIKDITNQQASRIID